jgi:hypothetical protein
MSEPNDTGQPKRLKLRTLGVWLPFVGLVLGCALATIAAFIVTSLAPKFRLLGIAVFVLCLSGISGLPFRNTPRGSLALGGRYG